ncbi:MAG: ATP-binding cassette domain-containing protein, partial [Lachnospiraceae bacterium]|nr:ATP-binding cassette domain-containing protein [Lachnospiraceae bacterium]
MFKQRTIIFILQQGEIFALLGVNGAGKTTSLECIEGLRKYDSG